ncbi:hypothetical protein GOBAR_DD10603 [Gossypium barbadense]|nr:hypothetical protein GOBAR_DD10603 [Gossypium barbadense]
MEWDDVWRITHNWFNACRLMHSTEFAKESGNGSKELWAIRWSFKGNRGVANRLVKLVMRRELRLQMLQHPSEELLPVMEEDGAEHAIVRAMM